MFFNTQFIEIIRRPRQQPHEKLLARMPNNGSKVLIVTISQSYNPLIQRILVQTSAI